MLALFVLFALVMCRYENEWNDFKLRFGRRYSDDEEYARFKIFKENMAQVNLLNKMDKSATYGVTQFSDLTSDEFAHKYLNYAGLEQYGLQRPTETMNNTTAPKGIPEAYDWSTISGKMNPVQDQGSCGSCWSFASTAVLESVNAIKHGNLPKLSEQQLVDCDKTNSGCNGGNLVLAAAWLKNNGLTYEANYPYVGVDQTCKTTDWVVQLSNYQVVTGGEEVMRQKLYENGPLVIAINANPVQFYTGGVLDPEVCNPNALNHAVVAVGYDVTGNDGTKWWKIRNSWSKSWGENGYFRMKYGSNTCGVANDVVMYTGTVQK